MKVNIFNNSKVVSGLLWTLFVILCLVPMLGQAGERFIKNDDGTVIDMKTGLMWSSRDNGFDINYIDAEISTDQSDLAGYTDWRLPDKKELLAIYDATRNSKLGFGITEKIKLTECCQWSSYDSMGSTTLVDFRTGKVGWMFKTDKQQMRYLMVRNPEELKNDEKAGK